MGDLLGVVWPRSGSIFRVVSWRSMLSTVKIGTVSEPSKGGNDNAGIARLHRLGKDLQSVNPECEFKPLAKNGARIDGVRDTITTLEPNSGRVLVTLTVGGNDLIAAVGSKDFPRPWVDRFLAEVDEVLASLGQLYRDLTLRYGNIYDPGDGTGLVQSGHVLWAEGFSFLPELNQLILDKADAHGGQGVDIYRHFLGAHAQV